MLVDNTTEYFPGTGNDYSCTPAVEDSVVGCTCSMKHKVVGIVAALVVAVVAGVVAVYPMLLLLLLFVVHIVGC